MITACNGMARPIRNRPFTERRKRLPAPPRTIAYAAMNETSTAGRVAPAVTTTLLVKYRAKSASKTWR
nr:hypothetical protein GCM10020092_061720 [Actinoplanes digitatis]